MKTCTCTCMRGREGGRVHTLKNANLSSFNAPIGFVKSLNVSGFVKSNNNNKLIN